MIKQVKFYDRDNDQWLGGIMVDNDYIICGCCGGTFEVNELEASEIIILKTWIDISDAIIGEE